MAEDITSIQADNKAETLDSRRALENIAKVQEERAKRQLDANAKKAVDEASISSQLADAFFKNQRTYENANEKSALTHSQNLRKIDLDTEHLAQKTIQDAEYAKYKQYVTNVNNALGKGKNKQGSSLVDGIIAMNAIEDDLNFALNNKIPLSKQQSIESAKQQYGFNLEQNKLQRNQNNIDLIKLAEREQEKLDTFKELTEPFSRHLQNYFNRQEAAMYAASYNASAQEYYDGNVDISSGFWGNTLGSAKTGAINFGDRIINGLVQAVTLGQAGDNVKPLEYLAKRYGIASVNVDNILSQEFDFLDRISLGMVSNLVFESLPEMFALGGIGGGIANIGRAVFGRTLSKVEKAIKVAKNGENTKALEALTSLRDNLIKLQNGEKGFSKAVWTRELGQAANASSISAKNLSKYMTAANMPSKLPLGLLGLDIVGRMGDIAGNRDWTLTDFFTALAHAGVDYAGAFAVLGKGSRSIFTKDYLDNPAKYFKKEGKLNKALGVGAWGLNRAIDMGIEGVGEGLQTYFELQGHSNYTLPDLATLLLDNTGLYKQQQRQIWESVQAGGVAAGATSLGVSAISGATSAVEQIGKAGKDLLGGDGDKREATTANTLSELTEQTLNEYKQAYDNKFSSMNQRNAETGEYSSESAKSFDEKQKELNTQIKTEAEKIQEAEKELEAQEQNKQAEEVEARKIYTDNTARIEELEAKEIKALQEKNTELAEQYRQIADMYRNLDTKQKSQQMSQILLEKIEDTAENKDELVNILTNLSSAETKEEQDKLAKEFVDKMSLKEANTRNEIFKSINSILEGNETPVKQTPINLTNQDEVAKVFDGKNIEIQNTENKNLKTQADGDNTDTEVQSTSNPETNTAEKSEVKETKEEPKEQDTTPEQKEQEVPIEAIKKLKDSDEKSIKDFLKALDAQSITSILAQSVSPTQHQSKAVKEFTKGTQLVYIPLEEMEFSSDNSVKMKNTDDTILKTRGNEIFVMSRFGFNAKEGKETSTRRKNEFKSQFQSAVRSLADIKNEKMKKLIQDILTKIEKGEDVNALLKSLKANWEEQLQMVAGSAIIIQRILKATGNKRLKTSLSAVLDTTKKALETTHKEILSLNAQLKAKANSVDKTILEKMEQAATSGVSIVEGENIVLSKLVNTSSKFFSYLQGLSENVLKNKDKNNRDLTFIRKILNKFSQILDGFTNYLNNEGKDLFNLAISALDTELETRFTTSNNFTFSLGEETHSIGMNDNVGNFFKASFSDLVYGFFGVKPYTTSRFILDSLIKLSMNTQAFGAKTIAYLEPILKQIEISTGMLETTPASRRNLNAAEAEYKTITINLYELMNLTPETIVKLFSTDSINQIINKEIDTTKELSETDRELLQDNLPKFKEAVNARLKQNDIRDRLSLAIESNYKVQTQLEDFLELGLVLYAQRITTESDIKDKENNNIPNDIRNQLDTTLKGKTIFPDSVSSKAQALGLIDKMFNFDNPAIKEALKEAIYEISMSMAETYARASVYGRGNTSIHESISSKETYTKYIAVPSNFKTELSTRYKDLIESFEKIIDVEELFTNDINKMIEYIRNMKNIPSKAKQAFVFNLQNTGYSYDKKTTEPAIERVYGKSIEQLEIRLSAAFDNEGNSQEDNFTLTREEFNALDEKFKNYSPKQKEEILKNKTSVDIPMNYQRFPRYEVQPDGRTKPTFVYVYMKDVTTLNNPSLYKQISYGNLDVDKLSSASFPTSIMTIVEKLKERQTQLGLGLFMTMSARVSLNPKKGYTEKYREYLKSKVDYSKPVYYFYDLLPNGRVAMKEAGTVMDNKFLREILKAHKPNKLKYFDKNEKTIKEADNKGNLQYRGRKITDFKELLKEPSKGFISGNFVDKEAEQIYLGILYSFARACNIDMEKFSVDEKTSNKLKNMSLKDYKRLREAQQAKAKLISQRQSTNKTDEQDNLDKQINKLDKKIDKILNGLDFTTFHYFYNGKAIDEILNRALLGDTQATKEIKDLFNEVNTELDGESYFKEHLGLVYNNQQIFLEALESGDLAKNLKTQDLRVYMDGSATFMMENGVRARSLVFSDAISGVFKGRFLSESEGIREAALTRYYVQKLSEELNISNIDTKEAFKEIIAKNQDIYTLSIGTTILALEPFSKSNLLTSIFTNSAILTRDYMKKLIQPEAYNAGIKGKLEKLKELAMIPTDFAITGTFQKFLSEPQNQDLIVELNKATNDNEIASIKTKIEENFLQSMLDYKKELEKDKKKNGETIGALDGILTYILNNPTFISQYLTLGTNFKNINESNKTQAINYLDWANVNNAIEDIFNTSIQQMTDYYSYFDFIKTDKERKDINTASVNVSLEIINSFKGTKGGLYKSIFHSLEEQWFKGLDNDEEAGTITNDNIQLKYNSSTKTLTPNLAQSKKIIDDIRSKLPYLKGELTDEEILNFVANVAHFYHNTNSFLPNHKPLDLRASPLLAITKQNNKYTATQKNYIENQTNNMMVASMVELTEKLLRDYKIDLSKTSIEAAYNNNKDFRNAFDIKKQQLLHRMREKFTEVAWINNMFISMFNEHPNQEQSLKMESVMMSYMDSVESRLKDNSKFFKIIPLLTVETTSYTNGRQTKRIGLTRPIGQFNDVVGLFNHPLEGDILTKFGLDDIATPNYQVFDAIEMSANDAEYGRLTFNSFSDSTRARLADSASVMKHYEQGMFNAIKEVMKKLELGTQTFEDTYNNFQSMTKEDRRALLSNLQTRIRQYIKLSQFHSIDVKNIPSFFPSDDTITSRRIRVLTEEYEEDIQTLQIYVNILKEEAQDTTHQRNKDANALIEYFSNVIDFDILSNKEPNLFSEVYSSDSPAKDLADTLYKKYRNQFTRSAKDLFYDTLSKIPIKSNNLLSNSLLKVFIHKEKANLSNKTQNNYSGRNQTGSINFIDISSLLDTKINVEKALEYLVSTNHISDGLKNLISKSEDMSIKDIANLVFIRKTIEELKGKIKTYPDLTDDVKDKYIAMLSSITDSSEFYNYRIKGTNDIRLKLSDSETIILSDISTLKSDSINPTFEAQVIIDLLESSNLNSLRDAKKSLNAKINNALDRHQEYKLVFSTDNSSKINGYNSLKEILGDKSLVYIVNDTFNNKIAETILKRNLIKDEDNLKNGRKAIKSLITNMEKGEDIEIDTIRNLTPEEYFQQIEEDIAEMNSEEGVINGKDISNELTQIQQLFKTLTKNMREGLEVVTTPLFTKRRGQTNTSIDKEGRTVSNTITLDASANRYTRLHEFWHAVTSFAALSDSNDANILIHNISVIQKRVKNLIDSTPGLAQQLGLITADGNTEKYEHIFNNKDILLDTQEFLATFLSEPKLIAYLSSITNKDLKINNQFNTLKGKTRIGKAISAFGLIFKYAYELIRNRFAKKQSVLQVLTDNVTNLSNLNTEEGLQAVKDKYNSKMVTRANRAITKRLSRLIVKDFDEFLQNNPEALQAGETKEQAKERFEKEIASDKNINEALEALNSNIELIKDMDGKKKTLAIAKYLIQNAFFTRRKLRKFLKDNPVKVQYVKNQLTELRHKLIDKTIFDVKFLMDFGFKPGDFLNKTINMVNRATSARNSINFEIENAATNTQKMVQAYLVSSPRLGAYLKDKETRDKYSTAMYKSIIQQNLGSFFTNESSIKQSDIDDLFFYQFYASNEELTKAANGYANAGINALGLANNSEEANVIRRFISDMAYTRITGKRNKFGSQNIELLLKQLGFVNYNAQAVNQLYKALTIQTIKTPKMMEYVNNEDIEYFNKQIEPLTEAYHNNLALQDDIKESFKNIVTLHQEKLNAVYTQNIINYEKANEYYKSTSQNELDETIYFDRQKDIYKKAPSFGRGTYDAIHDDAYQFLNYNEDIMTIYINPEDYGVTNEGKKALNKAINSAEKQGFKLIDTTDSGVMIYQYDGFVQYHQSKQRSAFIFKPTNHQGQAFFSLSEADIADKNLLKAIREEQKEITREALLEYGREMTDKDILSEAVSYSSFGGLGEFKSLAGSETITRENISNKKFEEWVKPDLSIDKAFYKMEQLAQEAHLRDFNNNQIFYQVIESDKYIKRKRISSYGEDKHHTEVLFTIDEGRVTFNEELKEKYGFNLTKQDERAFEMMAKVMGYNLDMQNTIYIDTRIMPILFSFNQVHIGMFAGKLNANFTKENNPTLYKLLSGIQTALRGVVKEARANTIIRNPHLIWLNYKSNIVGLIGEGIGVKEIADSIPFYTNQLNKYKEDIREKIRLENELAQYNKVEFRNSLSISAEEQLNEKKRLEKELKRINTALENNKLTPLMRQGLFSNVVEDAETTGFKLDKWILDKNQQITGMSDTTKEYLKEFFMTEDSDIYNTMADLTRMGDFVPRAILYYHLMEKRGYTAEKALDETRERFINYNTPMWSPVMRTLDYLGLTNYAKYKLNIQYQAIRAFMSAPVQASTMLGLSTALEAIGVPKLFTLDNYIAESFLLDGNVPRGLISGQSVYDLMKTAWRWNFVTP